MKKSKNIKEGTFIGSLKLILEKIKEVPRVKVRDIFSLLAGKGYAALLVILSIPFCIPVQIPGFSTPFGIVLAFLGLRIAFAKRLWWPRWILDKTIPSNNLEKLIRKTIEIVKYTQKMLHPRLEFMITNSYFHRLNGLIIFVLSILLSLPLPIPMTNMLSAFPILCIGLGLLEDDGLVILIGHVLAVLCFIFFLTVFFLGKEYLLS